MEKLLLFSLIALFSLAGCVSKKQPAEGIADRITVEKNNFMLNGKRIWINGTNTPWDNWNDFGGNFDDSWWNEHFQELHNAGINATRVWINCNNGNGAIFIDDDGMVYGASDNHWNDLDDFFQTAARNKIYIMATLLSFDHFLNENDARPDEAQQWRNMLNSDAACASFAENYAIPFVKRYGDNPWLWSIDLCNEPDWIFERAACGYIPWERISYFLAVNAAAIHTHSNVLVTVGMASPKYHSDYTGYEGNKISDAFLKKLYPHEKAYLDFWSPHYYDWAGQWYGVPFYVSPYGNRPLGFGLVNSKPAVVGECSANGSKGNTRGTENNTIITDYESAYQKGWQGVMPWTSNGVDGNGSLEDLSPGTKNMLAKYRDIIFP